MPHKTRDIRKLVLDSLEIPESRKPFLPRGFQRIGHVVVLNLSPEVRNLAKQIAKLVLDEFPYVRTVCLSRGISGSLRKPSVRYLAGDKSTETIHQENNCRFTLDVTRVMFSKGNLSERGRIPRLVRPGETVVDLFAGIGYFSIPIARNSGPSRVYSIEKNPDSFKYLRENIRLNRVQSLVFPIQGDCRRTAPVHAADRVLMGYLPGTRNFLPAAFRSLKPQGGFIHYHDNYHESELWDEPVQVLRTAASRSGFRLKEVSRKARVKEHSPRVYHVVIDAEFEKK